MVQHDRVFLDINNLTFLLGRGDIILESFRAFLDYLVHCRTLFLRPCVHRLLSYQEVLGQRWKEEVSSVAGRTYVLVVEVEHLDQQVGGSTRRRKKPVSRALRRVCAFSHL